jgi:PHD/YefM family antitoxin component YafN of YafNO toxin-antitoxin module
MTMPIGVHHGPRRRQGQRAPSLASKKIHRSLIAIRMTAGDGHPLQGFQRQLAQWGWADPVHIIGNTYLGSVRIPMVVTITSRVFNQDAAGAKRAASQGPVFITDRGRPAHVLLSISDLLALPGGEDLELPLIQPSELARAADLS